MKIYSETYKLLFFLLSILLFSTTIFAKLEPGLEPPEKRFEIKYDKNERVIIVTNTVPFFNPANDNRHPSSGVVPLPIRIEQEQLEIIRKIMEESRFRAREKLPDSRYGSSKKQREIVVGESFEDVLRKKWLHDLLKDFKIPKISSLPIGEQQQLAKDLSRAIDEMKQHEENTQSAQLENRQPATPEVRTRTLSNSNQ